MTDNIKKARKRPVIISSSKFNRRRTNLLVYVKFWKEACLFASVLCMLTPSLLLKLERCRLWFLEYIFYLPSLGHSTLILRLSDLNSFQSEIHIKQLLFLGRLITKPKMAPVVKNLFRSRTESYFDSNISSTDEHMVCFDCFKLWFDNSI